MSIANKAIFAERGSEAQEQVYTRHSVFENKETFVAS